MVYGRATHLSDDRILDWDDDLIDEDVQILHAAEPIHIQLTCIDPDDGVHGIELLFGCDFADQVVPPSDVKGSDASLTAL